LTNLKFLNLKNNKLVALPKEIGKLRSLLWLSLLNNQLASVPSQIGKLTKLRMLSLSDNQLTIFPPEIGELSNLWDLFFENNQLVTFLPPVERLWKFVSFRIFGNPIEYIPKELHKWRRRFFREFDENLFLDEPPVPQPDNFGKVTLKHPQHRIWFRDEYKKNLEFRERVRTVESTGRLESSALQKVCPVGCWPTANVRAIGPENKLVKEFISLEQFINFQTELKLFGDSDNEFERIQVLVLQGLQLTEIPPFVFECKNLERLFLEDNDLKEVPEEIGKLQKLTFIGLGGNCLRQLPLALENLTNLRGIILDGNPLDGCPEPLPHFERFPKLEVLSADDGVAMRFYAQCKSDKNKVRFLRLLGIPIERRKKKRTESEKDWQYRKLIFQKSKHGKSRRK
ncbi:leucine-rich repeat domain-containing protein, partial [bacterium]|nr:leucine-rich repeat domain-containing protein [bacterium]